ncbi:cytochrome P450 9e2-like, partial [Hyposmocoma kahamanoa]|uniref:cytochrome P450 9e2-like n=1 Tax=Hyposmocoma kahamanoa TaxID=1477025 RepID=UPI000E6D6D4D
MLVWIWLGCLLVALVLHLRQVYGTFKRRGVKTPPVIPLVGNALNIVLQRWHVTDELIMLYNKYSNQRFYGYFKFTSPVLVVRDIKMIKKIAIEDFEHFLDHNRIINKDTDPLFGRNLLALKGQEWKDMRSTLSPAFTSSKMKMMLPLMVEVGNQMIYSLKKKIKESDQVYLDIDVKDLTTRYANDVIASCAFGLKVNSHMEKNNQFYEMGKSILSFNIRQKLVVLVLLLCPKIAKIFKLTLFMKSQQEFFRKLISETMESRELQQTIRPDMIHLLMQAKKGKLTYDEKPSHGADTGFAAVEESSVGKKVINR